MHPVALKNQSDTAVRELAKEVRAHASTGRDAASARAIDLRRFTPADPQTQEEKVTKQVRNWVGQSFYGTLLKQMRESPFKSEMFDGGRGGEAFGQLFDQRLAQHMASGVGSKIVRPMVKKILNTSKDADTQYRKQKKSAATTQRSSHERTDRRA